MNKKEMIAGILIKEKDMPTTTAFNLATKILEALEKEYWDNQAKAWKKAFGESPSTLTPPRPKKIDPIYIQGNKDSAEIIFLIEKKLNEISNRLNGGEE